MSTYRPPSIHNIPFKFSSSGYTKPDFDKITYKFGLRPSYTRASDISAAIKVTQFYTEETYTYLKECKTIVVGYSNLGVQTLELPCVYGGIRDLFGYIKAEPPFYDLAAYIIALDKFYELFAFVRPNFREYKDLVPFIRPTITGNKDIYAFTRPTFRSSKDLLTYMFLLKGHNIEKDLSAYLELVDPVNLKGLLNVIEIRNIKSYINGVWWHGLYDLAADFYKIYFRNTLDIKSYIHGFATEDLKGFIRAFWYYDLPAQLNAGFFAIHYDLLAKLRSIEPLNLKALLHGYDLKNLQAYLVGSYGPNDLRAYVNINYPIDIKSYIHGYKGLQIQKDLLAIVSGYLQRDLYAYINTIESKLLKAYISSIGKYLDLPAYIIPKTINIKRVILISLLEHKDLMATINYNCLKSGYLDLIVNMHLMHKYDLKSYIIGWYGNYADNVVNLKAYINVKDSLVVNSLNINYFPNIYRSEHLDVAGGNDYYHVNIDLLTVLGALNYKNLKSYIYGNLRSVDLQATLRPRPLPNYTPLPDWVKPKNREVVINLRRFEPRWRRFIDLMFFTNAEEDFHYFYVSGTKKVYKIDKNRTWVIWVTGYSYNPNSIKDRVGVRKKFIFNLNDYATIDDAIRTMIDRVTELRKRELKITINGVLDRCKDLKATLNLIKKYTWNVNLKSNITPINKNMSDLSASITVT